MKTALSLLVFVWFAGLALPINAYAQASSDARPASAPSAIKTPGRSNPDNMPIKRPEPHQTNDRMAVDHLPSDANAR